MSAGVLAVMDDVRSLASTKITAAEHAKFLEARDTVAELIAFVHSGPCGCTHEDGNTWVCRRCSLLTRAAGGQS